MARDSTPRGASDAVSSFPEEQENQRTATVLENQEMFRRETKPLPGLGVQGRRLLLAYKRNHLRGAAAKYLGGKDARLPNLQGVNLSTLTKKPASQSLLNS